MELTELLHAIGKLAYLEGEAWRLDHPELMDAYQACLEAERNKWNKLKDVFTA